ncbi:MAG TPA: nucleoside hydrolase [Spirochaetia bacterium]|nr:nucleoside hydrolase [Spirochaetia bacterium]
MAAKKILIDTDCGVDDAIAIMMALASPHEVSVMGITTVSGNVQVDNVVDNVLRLLSFLDRTEIPVFRGASRPLVEPPHHAADVHGGTGLGDAELPPASFAEQPRSAPEGIVRIARENPGITLLTLGPLTNVAIALNLFPELKGLIAEIVAMGGAIETGNVTRFAEFNFHADPEAVQSVLDAGVAISLLTWDATVKLPHTQAELESIGLNTSASGRLVLALQQTVFRFNEKARGVRLTMLPDPLAAAWLIEPRIARRVLSTGMRMELDHSTMRGASVTQRGDGIRLILDIDKPGFDLILSRVIGLKK